MSSLTTCLADVAFLSAIVAGFLPYLNINYLLLSFMIPMIFVAPVAGILADMISKKSILFVVSIAKMLLAAAFMFLGMSKTPAVIYLFVFLTGAATACVLPVYNSILPNLINTNQLQKANAFTMLSIMAAIIPGGIIFNKLSGTHHAGMIVYICIVLYAVAAVSALLLKYKRDVQTRNDDLIYGFRKCLDYLKKHRTAGETVVMSFWVSIVTIPVLYLAYAVMFDYWGANTSDFSWFKLILTVGMILGLLIMTCKTFKAKILLGGAYAHLFFQLLISLCVNTMNTAWVFLTIIGAFSVCVSVGLDTFIQKTVPDNIRGKTFGLRIAISTLMFTLVPYSAVFLSKYMGTFMVYKIIALVSAVVIFSVFLRDEMIGYMAYRYSLIWFFLFQYRIKAEGSELVPQRGGIIYAGNHTGWWDALILINAITRPFWFVTGPRVFGMPILKLFIHKCNIVPLTSSNGEEGLLPTVEKLKKGDAVLIFPEGHMTLDGNMQKFRKGVLYLQKATNAPIVPFAISGGFKAWRKGQKFPKMFITLRVKFGAPLYYDNVDNNTALDDLRSRVIEIKDSMEK